ncbi:MAG: hypothetical protein EZS28_000877 [Streblomastix strix]|uniref:Hemerythrin-like domain-containing protein n=1 Tax=Streblomastix strix TaxID=222440 RepID=A0A5J4X8S6_9EUKA|nr:MAG: hypothetical protein EZS28_000877 [Streblomastix strix]
MMGSNQFISRLNNLIQVCHLIQYETHLANYCLVTLFNDIKYNFSYPGINDGKPETIKPWHDLKQSFIQDADKITNVVQNVYDQTQVTDPWEVIRNRHEVMIQLFDVPKARMQSVIRRILQEENGEGDQYSTINANNDFADMKLGLNDKQDQQNCEKHDFTVQSSKQEYILSGVSLVAIITYIIIVVIYVSYNQQTSAVVILSGLRSPVLQQSSYFILRTICDFKCVKPIKNIVFPIWTDDTHTTTDRKLALQTAYQLSNHFLKLLMNVHYGTNKYSAITDHHLSSIKTQRMDYNLNADLLFKQSDCFLTTVPCDEASPDRIYSVELPIFGLQELIVRMRFYLELMVHMNPQQLDEKNRYVRYLVTAIRNDLREGFNQLTSDIEKQGEDSINDSQTVLIIIAVCFSITILGTMILVALPWGFSMQDRTNQSQRLIDLMPYLENEKEMALLPSMRTGHIKMDKQREIIMDQGEQIINAMKRHDQIGTVIQLFDVLIGSVQKTFNEEDKEMEEKEYDIEKANHHIEDHIILRQRLTLLLDELRSLSGKREAVQNTVRKTLTRLFDHHFLDQDVAFVKSVFKFDNQTENNYTQEDANNEKMEQQITNISDMHSDI